MASVTIKDIPEELHAKLKDVAAAHGRSLNKEIVFRLKASLTVAERPGVDEVLEEARRIRETMNGVFLTGEFLDHAKREGRL